MESKNNLEIHISGSNDVGPIAKDNFDIRELNGVLDNLIRLANISKTEGYITLSEIDEGCAKLKFNTAKVFLSVFCSIFGSIKANPSLEGIEPPIAEVIEWFQESATRKRYSYKFVADELDLTISSNTHFLREKSAWMPAEFYFYGELRDAGGGTKVNIHLATKEYGPLVINTNEDILRSIPDNILFRDYEVHASGLQNTKTGEIDRNSLNLIELRPFSARYDEEKMHRIYESVGNRWDGIDIDEYIRKIRGYE